MLSQQTAVHDDDAQEELNEEDRHAIAASREYFRQGGQGLSFEQVAAGHGLVDTASKLTAFKLSR